MEQLVGRIRRMRMQTPGCKLRDISDALLLALLSQSEYLPDRVNSGVTLFEKGEAINYWYLMLSGEVELYLPVLCQKPCTSSAPPPFHFETNGGASASTRLKLVEAGCLFGDLNLDNHSCSARVRKTSEFVRIPQEHFFSLYKKHADHLQPFILVMEDLVSEIINSLSTPTKKKRRPHSFTHVKKPLAIGNSAYNFGGMRKELSAQINNNDNFNLYERTHSQLQNSNYQPFNDDQLEYIDQAPPHLFAFSSTAANLFELSNSISLESRVSDAALVLKRTMQLKAPMLIGERRSQHMDCFEVFQNAMVGAEMTQWLGELIQQLFATLPLQSFKPPNSLQLVGMWQTLLDFHFISHVKHEQNFKDKHVFYRWTIEDPLEELYRNRRDDFSMDGTTSLQPSSSLLQEFKKSVLQSSVGMDMGEDGLPTFNDLQNAICLLSNLAPDSMFRVILSKAPYERFPAEVELVFQELLHVKALSHLSTMVKRELASVIRLEQHQHAGTVLFHQGERGESWYILLRGSVDVSILGKGVVCTLHEGDDFGKLALVNDAPRAASIALREDNSQFLRVDKHDFNRILRDVEENTVRLKEHGQDVLVLERIVACQLPNSRETGNNQFSFSVMAGLPEKMVEYLLETRIDTVSLDFNCSPGSENGLTSHPEQGDQTTFGLVLTNELDTCLEDFILTHTIFMPSNLLCNYLKNYYLRNYKLKSNRVAMAAGLSNSNQINPMLDSDFDFSQQLTAKRRVVVFLAVWQHVLGIHLFLDSVANSFVEEMYCCVLEDAKFIPKMMPIVAQISQLRQLRENAMQILSRHPTLILDCGVYSSQAPAPNPILPIDICNQCIYLSDTTFITMNVRLDKPTAEITALARAKIRKQRRHKNSQQLNTPHHLLQMDRIANGYSPQQMHRHLLRNGYREEEEVVNEGEQQEEEDDSFLIEVKSNGERVVFAPTEVSVPTMLSLNGRLYVVFKEEIDSLLPLAEQEGPMEPTYHSVLDLLSCQELALQLSIFHTQLFEATDETELVIQVIGRDQFPGRMPSNLDLLLRRFNEVQYWVSTEVLLASNSTKRLNILKKFVKIAMHAKEHKDLMSLFAITLGLSNVAVSRLSHLWMKISGKMRRQYADFEALLDPSRNHRAYRLLVAKMRSPIVPFVPLLLKDLTFIHEGNKTSFAGLINFEKMQMIASVLKNFRNCKSNKNLSWPLKKSTQSLIRNFRVIDNQRRLMELSYQIEPPPNSNYISSDSKITHF